MCRTIGIISIKGGVGKTSTASALGASLANDLGKKVLIVDANFSAPSLGLHIGLINPEITLHHVLNDQASALDAIHETNFGFDIIPGAHIFEKIDPFKLSEKIKEVKKKYDFIILDSSPNLNEEILATMVASDELIVVTTPDHVTLFSTVRAIRAAKEKKTPIIGLILNKVYDKNFELPLEYIEEASGSSVLAVLPHDINFLESLARKVPLIFNRASDSTLEFRKLASSLAGQNYSERKGIKNWFSGFFKKVPKQDVNRTIFALTRNKEIIG